MPVIDTGGSPNSTGTYTPEDALKLVQNFVHGIDLADVGPILIDQVQNIIWRKFFWRWSVKSFTPFSLSDGQQDYINVMPVDFFRFRQFRIVRTDITPVEHRELDQKAYLGVELSRQGGIDDIRTFSIQPELTGGIRLEKAPTITGDVTMELQGEYQYVPLTITQAQLKTPFIQPDIYFDVITEGLQWRIYKFTDDPRAGSVAVNREGAAQYSGQLGEFMNALNAMAQAEGVDQGQAAMFPADPIGWTRVSNPGIFGSM
jgi:hypothetical protein